MGALSGRRRLARRSPVSSSSTVFSAVLVLVSERGNGSRQGARLCHCSFQHTQALGRCQRSSRVFPQRAPPAFVVHTTHALPFEISAQRCSAQPGRLRKYAPFLLDRPRPHLRITAPQGRRRSRDLGASNSVSRSILLCLTSSYTNGSWGSNCGYFISHESKRHPRSAVRSPHRRMERCANRGERFPSRRKGDRFRNGAYRGRSLLTNIVSQNGFINNAHPTGSSYRVPLMQLLHPCVGDEYVERENEAVHSTTAAKPGAAYVDYCEPKTRCSMTTELASH